MLKKNITITFFFSNVGNHAAIHANTQEARKLVTILKQNVEMSSSGQFNK